MALLKVVLIFFSFAGSDASSCVDTDTCPQIKEGDTAVLLQSKVGVHNFAAVGTTPEESNVSVPAANAPPDAPISGGGGNVDPGVPPCAKTCPQDAHPSCEVFKGMIGSGGCAESCSDDVVTRFAHLYCPGDRPGDVPPCAASCPQVLGPQDPHPDCDAFKGMIGSGGCAANCSDDVKRQYGEKYCGGGRPNGGGPGVPPCAKTCPQDAHPSCDEFKVMVEGCAASCSDDVKRQYGQLYCGGDRPDGGPHVPQCAASCPQDAHPDCDAFKGMIGSGGCAANCSDDVKRQYGEMYCGGGRPNGDPDDRPDGGQGLPPSPALIAVQNKSKQSPDGGPDDGPDGGLGVAPCAKTCPQDAHPSCEAFKGMIGAGGCAASCSDAVVTRWDHLYCPVDRPGDVPPCAASCPTVLGPQDPHPDCDALKGMIGSGGCAESCSDDVKRQYGDKYCGGDRPNGGPDGGPDGGRRDGGP